MKRSVLWSAALLLLLSVAVPAGAAGWYLKGTLGFEWSLAADYEDADPAAANPPAFFGVGPGSDGRRIGAYGDFGRFPLLEAAIGRQLLPWLRSEVAVAYRPDLRYRGEANFRGVPGGQPVSASADSLSGMVNLFLDIAGLTGADLGRFQPYIGGGLGLARNRQDEMTYLFPGNPGAHKVTVTPAGAGTDLTFMGSIGTGIVMSRRILLDVSYRYTDLGSVRTEPGKMFLDTVPAGIDIAETRARLRTHGAFAGVRYLFE